MGPHALYIAIISWPGWPGYVKGAEFSAIDVLALAIYLSQPRSRQSLPFLFSMGLYFTAVVVSILPAQVPMAAMFYAWQLARMFLVYLVVARACSDDRVAPSLLTGMAVGICVQVVMTTWQRFGLGILQTGGTIGEKNLLGIMTQFVGIPWFALLLAGQQGRMPLIAPLGSAITSILTISRAAIGLNAAGMALVFILSAIRKWTPRKAKIALLSAFALILLLPIAFSSFEDRFSAEPSEGGYDERAAFQAAARMIVADHPFGVGANNYVVVANVDGYNARAQVAQTSGSLSTNVHNTYLLAAAETGYFGLLTLVILFLRPLIVAFHCGWKNRADRRSDLLLGLGVALLTVYIHCYFEWIFLTFLPLYLFAMTTGLVAGLAQQLGYWGHARALRLLPEQASIETKRLAMNRRVK
jgi:O-antigen ligase